MRSSPRRAHRAAGSGALRVRATTLLLSIVLVVASGACDGDDGAIEVEAGTIEAGFATAEAMEATLVRDGPVARRVAGHRLTPERIARWSDAQRRIDDAMRADPALLGRLDERLRAQRRSDPVEFAVARLDGDPAARRAIEGAGLSVRDFVLTTLALYQAQLASDADSGAEIRALVNENVDVFAAQRAEVERLDRGRVRYVIYDRDDDTDTDADDDTDTDIDTDTDTDTDEDTERRRSRQPPDR